MDDALWKKVLVMQDPQSHTFTRFWESELAFLWSRTLKGWTGKTVGMNYEQVILWKDEFHLALQFFLLFLVSFFSQMAFKEISPLVGVLELGNLRSVFAFRRPDSRFVPLSLSSFLCRLSFIRCQAEPEMQKKNLWKKWPECQSNITDEDKILSVPGMLM